MKIIEVRDYIRYKTLTIPAPKEPLQFRDYVLLKAPREHIVAEVRGKVREVPNVKVAEDISFLRKLADEEVTRFLEQQKGECERVRIIQEEADRLNLPMKFFASRIGWSKKVYSFLFVSENPVDFRELLKSITKKFPGRIHLQRVDPRERAEIIGGIGPCGRLECCTYLRLSNRKVSLDAVRDQGIMIKNNDKIYDVSGKLKRCLLYELDAYKSERKYLPHLKQEVIAEGKPARVTGLDILNKKVKVMFLEDNSVKILPVGALSYQNQHEKEAEPEIEIELPTIDIYGTSLE